MLRVSTRHYLPCTKTNSNLSQMSLPEVDQRYSAHGEVCAVVRQYSKRGNGRTQSASDGNQCRPSGSSTSGNMPPCVKVSAMARTLSMCARD